jgi:predicted ATPase/class 3 adenylate cyclase
VNGQHDARRPLPSGTVTLLFADVEGSTRLLNLLGERFGPARARMRELVREAASAHDGAEVDWAGDGVFLAFSRARDAVAAAARIQVSLANEPWPDEEAHRLRIGLHTGEPELGPEGYVGIDVVIAARICGSAHGEQIVVSQATRDVSGEMPLADASYRPLGRHRLKDVPKAVQLFQLVAPGLIEDFPPLKTLTATSLPALHHRLVGREDALARVSYLVDERGARLVTITGPGGAGKSRLALEVAAGAALDRPVHLVGLAPITNVDFVPSAIARALGVREPGSEKLLDAVADRLEGTGALLFLDNLEHLPGASVHVAALLDRAPDVQVLVTSRTPLRLTTEHILPLEPLSIEDATTLFVELAAARGVVLRPEALASVHEICRRLDGLPLAIELVAARLVVLPPAEIIRALEEGLALEMEGPIDLPERQRTLRAAIDWSYGRLTDEQRALHGALAVFNDSASLDDARTLAPVPATFLSDLEGLVGWSLVRSEADDGAVRLSMLETVREHALEQLRARDALDDMRTRHAERFLALALAAEPELAGEDQAAWLDRLELDFDNIAAAIDWLLTAGRANDALRAISALERFWRGHAHATEARRWLSRALASPDSLADDVRAAALRTAAIQAASQSDWLAAETTLAEARGIYGTLGEQREEVLALGYLSFFATRQGEVERGEEYAKEAVSIAADLDDDRSASGALSALAEVYSAKGQHELAVASYEEAATMRARLGDPLLTADATYALGKAAFQANDVDRARRELERALEQSRAIGEAGYIAASLLLLSLLDLRTGDAPSAHGRAGEALALYSHLGDDRSRARCVVILASAAAAQGRSEHAARLLGAADALRGDVPPDEFESPLLEHLVPELEAHLGSAGMSGLVDQGRSADLDDLARVLVSLDVEA